VRHELLFGGGVGGLRHWSGGLQRGSSGKGWRIEVALMALESQMRL
jgi:hypothetical protein